MSTLARRIERLEASIGLAVSPEVRALAERMAAEDGDLYTADELLTEVRETMQAIGPPYTLERYAAHVAAELGCTVAELMADAARLAERYP
jgi:hypothetical protein